MDLLQHLEIGNRREGLFSTMSPLQRLKASLAHLAKTSVWSWLQFITIVVLSAYAYIALNIRYTNAEEIRKLRTDVERLEHTYMALSDALQLRVQALESTTYVDVLAELQKRSTQVRPLIEAWQKNRDTNVNQRLQALERWRYRMEGNQP